MARDETPIARGFWLLGRRLRANAAGIESGRERPPRLDWKKTQREHSLEELNALLDGVPKTEPQGGEE